MDHAYIEDHQVVGRYLMGKLSPEELGLFEEHYLSCAECLDRLQTTEDLARALKRVAGQEAAGAVAAQQLAAVAWLARLGRSRQSALLAAALLAVLLVPGLAIYRTGRLGHELQETRSALATAGAREHAEQAAGRREIEQERGRRAAIARDLALARTPQADVPVLYLGTERGPDPAGGPTARLRLPATPGWVVLTLPLETPHPEAIRLVISRADGREVWRSAALRSDRDSLTIMVPSGLLAPGDHVLAVAGAASGSREIQLARFSFRVLAPG